MYWNSRNGLPLSLAKLRAGSPLRVVAFGTSITHDGYYLEHVVAKLQTIAGRTAVSLETVGRRMSVSAWAAHCVAERVLPLTPDLVLLEFAVNDALYARDTPYDIASVMHGIVGQIRRAQPHSEFAFVYFASTSVPATTVAETVAAHEAVAEYYGFPSFDLNQLSNDLVASGSARWTGSGASLTTDGVHHTPAAATLIGLPFAAKLAAIVAESDNRSIVVPKTPATPYLHATSVRPSELRANGNWEIGPAPGFQPQSAGSTPFGDEIALATSAGSSLKLAFTGSELTLTAYTIGGELALREGTQELRLPIPADPEPRFVPIRLELQTGFHDLDIVAIQTPVGLGDILFIGERTTTLTVEH